MVTTLEKTIPEKWDSVKENISMNMVFVEILDGNKVHGEVQCIFCQQNNKENRINVSTKTTILQKHAKLFWIMSNFKEHLKQVHILAREKKRGIKHIKSSKNENNRQEEAKPNENVQIGGQSQLGSMTSKNELNDLQTSSLPITNAEVKKKKAIQKKWLI